MSYSRITIALLLSFLFCSSCSRLPATDMEPEVPAMSFSLACGSFADITKQERADFRETDLEIDRMDVAVFLKKQGAATCLFQNLYENLPFSKHESYLTGKIENPLRAEMNASPEDTLVCVFIANGKKLSYPDLLHSATVTLEEFKKTVFGWKEQPADGPLIMTGVAEVKVKHLLSSSVVSPVPISLALERRVACMDFVNRTSGYEMKSIYLKNIRNATTLLDVTAMWEATLPDDVLFVEAFSAAHHSFYVFPCKNVNNIQVVVEGIYNGRPLTLTAPFVSSRALMNIEANTIYKVIISENNMRTRGNLQSPVALQIIE